MPTPAQIAAIAAALSAYLEAEVKPLEAPAPSAWAVAARVEALGRWPGFASRDEVPPSLLG